MRTRPRPAMLASQPTTKRPGAARPSMVKIEAPGRGGAGGGAAEGAAEGAADGEAADGGAADWPGDGAADEAGGGPSDPGVSVTSVTE